MNKDVHMYIIGLLYLSFLCYFFKLVCYAHVFPCTCNSVCLNYYTVFCLSE